MLEQLNKNKRRYVLGLIMVALFLSVSIPAIHSAGIVWDETRHISNAKARLYSVYSAATGKEQLDMCRIDGLPDDPEDEGRCWAGRPRLSQNVAAITWGIGMAIGSMSLDIISSVAAHRMSTVLMVALSIFFIALFMDRAYGPKAAVLSTLALIFMPRFFTHSLYATLDAPTAAMMVIASYFLWRGTESRKFAVAAGVVFGLALAAKMTAFLMPAVIIPWLLICYRDKIPEALGTIKRGKIFSNPLVVLVLSLLVISSIIFIVSWPWLWYDTLGRLMGYLGMNVGHETTMNVGTYYLGESFMHTPWHYSWTMLLATVPVFILFFSLLGGIRTLKEGLSLENRAGLLILFGFLLLPVVFSTSLATPHDAVRLYMPTLPFIAMLAGIGASTFLDLLGNMSKMQHTAAFLIICILVSAPGALAMLGGTHTTANYYNSITGGIQGAYDKNLEMDYYGESYGDVVLWLNGNIPEGSSVYAPLAWNIMETYKYGDIGQIAYRLSLGKHGLDSVSENIGVFSFSQRGLLREDIALVDVEEESDYYILLMRRASVEKSEKMNRYLGCQPLHSIDAGGVPQALIYKTGCD